MTVTAKQRSLREKWLLAGHGVDAEVARAVVAAVGDRQMAVVKDFSVADIAPFLAAQGSNSDFNAALAACKQRVGSVGSAK
jgi:hypothetical protein